MISKGKFTGLTMIILSAIMILFSVYLVLSGALAETVSIASIIIGGILFVFKFIMLAIGIMILASVKYKIKYDNENKK